MRFDAARAETTNDFVWAGIKQGSEINVALRQIIRLGWEVKETLASNLSPLGSRWFLVDGGRIRVGHVKVGIQELGVVTR